MEESYLNAYKLLTGEITLDDLADRGVTFYLPVDYENPDVTLKYYESIEEYEKCTIILKLKNKENEDSCNRP